MATVFYPPRGYAKNFAVTMVFAAAFICQHYNMPPKAAWVCAKKKQPRKRGCPKISVLKLSVCLIIGI